MITKLINAPIVEAVFEFFCDPAESSDVTEWPPLLKEDLGDRYPKLKTKLTQEVKFSVSAPQNQPTSNHVKENVSGHLFFSPDDQQIVQCRVDGMFFNRLAPYSSFDDHLPEALRCWNIFRNVSNPSVVKKLGMRYINRLPLPFKQEAGLDLSDFLANPPTVFTGSEKYTLMFTNFVHKHQMIDQKNDTKASVTLASKPIENSTLPIVFEISVIRDRSFLPQETDELSKTFQELRELKNDIFENTLTEKCLKLFH